MPLGLGRHSTCSNLSSAFEANSRASSPRPSRRKLTTNRPPARRAGSVREVRSTQTRSSGGSAETDETAVVVSPRGVPSTSRVVTTATPAGYEAMISTNVSRSTGIAATKATGTRPAPRRPSAGGRRSLGRSPPPPPPEQLLRHERPRPRPEAGAGMGARADVPEPVDVGAVAGQPRPRAPDEVLVERARPRVDVAARHVRVRRLDVGGRGRDPPQDRRLEVRCMGGDPRLDPVGVRLTQRLRPRAVADVDLAGRVAHRA